VAGSSSFSDSARQQAQHILSQPPYRTTPSNPPRPLAGVLHALGRALNAAFGHPAQWIYHHVLLHIGHGFRSTFGGFWVVVLGVIAVGLGVVVGIAVVRRRTLVSTGKSALGLTGVIDENPDDIDERASAAEESGDHETAVRLRFRAGLLRLQAKGLVANQTAQTARQLSATLHSPTFDALAGRHEVIVYARDPATSDDSATARRDWPRVVGESRSFVDERRPLDSVGASTP
jgi:hypothetical protein